MTDPNAARAVIEAARAFVEIKGAAVVGQFGPNADPTLTTLVQAVAAYETAVKGRVVEIPWSEVCEGDQLKSDKNEKFYPVTYVTGLRVTVEVKGKPMSIERPAGQATTVVRGPEGLLRDTFPGTEKIS